MRKFLQTIERFLIVLLVVGAYLVFINRPRTETETFAALVLYGLLELAARPSQVKSIVEFRWRAKTPWLL